MINDIIIPVLSKKICKTKTELAGLFADMYWTTVINVEAVIYEHKTCLEIYFNDDFQRMIDP